MKWIVKIFPVLLMCNALNAQDIHFSQFNATPYLLSPGATGMHDGIFRTNMQFRNQWPAMSSPYRTVMAGADAGFKIRKQRKSTVGTGFYVESDKAGDGGLGQNTINLLLSTIIQVGKNGKLGSGIGAAFTQRHIDYTQFQWPSQFDAQGFNPNITPNYPVDNTSDNFFDLSAGFNYQLEVNDKEKLRDMEISAGAFNLLMPDQNLYGLVKDKTYIHFTSRVSMRYDFPESKFGITPSIAYSIQGPSHELLVGLLCRYRKTEGTKITGFKTETSVSAGIMYRNKDAIIPVINLEYSQFAFGISYDLNFAFLSQAKGKSGGAELMMRYQMPYNKLKTALGN